MKTIQQLLAESEHKCDLQGRIIQNQERLIENLQEINSALKEQLSEKNAELEELNGKFRELLLSYDTTADLCSQQQQLLNSILADPDR